MSDIPFSVGPISFVAAVVCMMAYTGNLLLRKAAAWFQGKEGPTDRVIPSMLLWATIGFLLGCVIQYLGGAKLAAYMSSCNGAGIGLIPCFFGR